MDKLTPNVRLKVVEDGGALRMLRRREEMYIIVTTNIKVLLVSVSTTMMEARGHGKEKAYWEEDLGFKVDLR